MTRWTRHAWLTCGLLCTALSTGCATLHFPWDDRTPVASARNPVVQVLCLWEPSEGRDPNGHPCRGFAGQIIFQANHNGEAVKVDGDVAILVYDDQGTPEDQEKPQHEFDFDSGAWSRHLRVGTLGPTYNVFVPYTRKGNHHAVCTLKVRYKPKQGAEVVSDAARIILPGKQKANLSSPASAKPVEPQAAQVEPLAPNRAYRSTSIPLNGPAAPSETDLRLSQRAEAMLQDFLQQQARRRLAAVPAADNVAAADEPDDRTSRRFRLDGAPARLPQPQLAANTPEDAAPVSSGRRNFLAHHPLADADDGGVQSASYTETAVTPRRRHPLADEPAFGNGRRPYDQRVGQSPPVDDASEWSAIDDSTEPVGQHLDDSLEGRTSQVQHILQR